MYDPGLLVRETVIQILAARVIEGLSKKEKKLLLESVENEFRNGLYHHALRDKFLAELEVMKKEV